MGERPLRFSEYQTKTILVLEQTEFFEEEPSNLGPIIETFTLYPNPSNGVFNVSIELRETLPVSLKIFGLANNTMIDHRSFQEDTSYTTSYNLNLPSGVYFLILETAYATQLKKIIID
ncbi:T9SS type A sorting domain-containing protein [Olleya sp. ITB9]|uniref:T9SS type A sorting domain-containing protein n=1 Tax=Olleya sp. ITB9 TaxID=1715648 RepID=UPI0021C59717|nr:T9SS type A sorting domain-containing protein [Olleya sp. ITB9]